jgi:hypothetical protein
VIYQYLASALIINIYWLFVDLRKKQPLAMHENSQLPVRMGMGRPRPGLEHGSVGLEAHLRGNGSRYFKNATVLAEPMGNMD